MYKYITDNKIFENNKYITDNKISENNILQ